MNKYPNRGPRRDPGKNSYSPRDGDNYMQRGRRIPPSSSGQKNNFSTGTIAVLAGVLILGVGIGSAITSTTDGGQGNIASTAIVPVLKLFFCPGLEGGILLPRCI